MLQLHTPIEKNIPAEKLTYLEFFAGGGMVRAGLGPQWNCLFANDIDERKAQIYRENWAEDHFITSDINGLSGEQVPGNADLAWASFPCQDLSLAGARAGLSGGRSGTFWPFINLMQQLDAEKRAPSMIILENVPGVLTSHEGADFSAIARALKDLNYRYGVLLIDAAFFLPQSRPRVFILAVKADLPIAEGLLNKSADEIWSGSSVVRAFEGLSQDLRDNWLWWSLPLPPRRNTMLADMLDEEPEGVKWRDQEHTKHLLSLMADAHLEKVREAQILGNRQVGTIYRRTRNGKQRAEIRFDGVAGCLRTPAGGSSLQTIMIIEGESIRTRLLSPREAARLMGLPEDYKLPKTSNAAYQLAGDGVVVPVIRHLSENIFEPLLESAKADL